MTQKTPPPKWPFPQKPGMNFPPPPPGIPPPPPKKPTSAPILTKKPVINAPKEKTTGIAIFIDLENTNASLDNVLEIISTLSGKGKIRYGKFYGYTDQKREFEEITAEHRFETVGASHFKSHKNSVIDARLVVDAIRLTLANDLDTVFVWAGVGDLVPLFTFLREQGVKIATIDNSIYDTQNKFVDWKIKLFSPHKPLEQEPPFVVKGTHEMRGFSENVTSSDEQQPTLVKVAPDRTGFSGITTPQISTPPTPKAKTESDDDLIDGLRVPALPRKKGAPEFGAKETISAFDEQHEETDDEAFVRMANKMMSDLEKESDRYTFGNDFGSLNEAPSIDKYDGGVSHKYNADDDTPPRPKGAVDDFYDSISDFSQPSTFGK